MSLSPERIEITRRWRQRNRTRANEQARAYVERNRDKRNAQSRASSERHPEKKAARKELDKAVRRGEIKRLPCGDCGATKAHAHHEDYSKPLDVMWLCTVCHGKRHRLAA